MQQRLSALAVAATLAAAALAGCNRHDERTAGQQLDSAIAKGKQESRELQADASKAMERTRERGSQAGQELRDAKDQAVDAVSDAAITASVNAELARDPKLSAIGIDVDTSGGRVALHGSAPDAASKERAAQLAANVKGVHGVDNQLTIAPARP